jgi:O-antigen ligase
MYRDSSLPLGLFWDRAHNTYLELLQGLGVPVATLFMLGIANLMLICVHSAATGKASSIPTVAVVAASAVVCLHTLVDFSLQVQAVALTWAALLGAGGAQSLRIGLISIGK